MDIQKIMREQHKIIMMIGLGAGLLAAIDACGFFDIGFVNMNFVIHIILCAAIAVAGYTYHTLFWDARFRPKKPQGPPPAGPPPQQGPQEATRLEDINPPEMTGEQGGTQNDAGNTQYN